MRIKNFDGCPCCGSKKLSMDQKACDEVLLRGRVRHSVTCDICGINAHIDSAVVVPDIWGRLADLWNRRPDPDLEKNKYDEFLEKLSMAHYQHLLPYEELRKCINELLSMFSERDTKIIKHRIGYDRHTPKTLQQVGDKFGITRERVRQIEEKIWKQLLDPSTKNYFELQLKDHLPSTDRLLDVEHFLHNKMTKLLQKKDLLNHAIMVATAKIDGVNGLIREVQR